MSDSPSYQLSAKSNWLQRSFTLAVITIFKSLRPRQSSVLFLTSRICIKYGPLQHLSEADAMQFIGSNTSIPVPKVYCAFEQKGIAYIVMSRLPGSPIGQNWSKRSDQSKARLLEQLKGYIQEMRTLKPPTSGVKGVNGSKLYDMRIPGGVHGFGPFDTVRDFHSFLTSGIQMSPDQFPEVNELIMMHENSHFTTCFTHGDLNSANILVNGDDVVGIVDWDTCGWYPEY